MSNHPPLNPDALEAASNAVRRISLGEVNSWDVSEAAITAYLAAAQPAVNSVEVIPAKIQTISWESNPEHNVWTLEQDQTFVGLVVDAQRSWSVADKITLHIERPEVKP